MELKKGMKFEQHYHYSAGGINPVDQGFEVIAVTENGFTLKSKLVQEGKYVCTLEKPKPKFRVGQLVARNGLCWWIRSVDTLVASTSPIFYTIASRKGIVKIGDTAMNVPESDLRAVTPEEIA